MIDPDVAAIAKQWGLDPCLLQAVVTAEGDIVKAVQCSIPTIQTRAAALDVLCRSCAHALNDYVRAYDAPGFVAFWQQRWAPEGAKNDPTGLNSNWSRNVRQLWSANRAALVKVN